MAPQLRPPSKSKHWILSSRKDRVGVILLLTVTLVYWLVSRPNFFKNSRCAVTEIPLVRKPSQLKAKEMLVPPTIEWNSQRKFPRYPEEKGDWRQGSFRSGSSYRRNPALEKQAQVYPKKATLVISLNSSDSIAWEQLPGIGPVLAARIIKYREKLGGFHSTPQLKEVFGITDSVYEKIAPSIKTQDEKLLKIDINKASLDELKKHPYLRWVIANAIVRYREANGRFQSTEDLKKIWSISPATILKIEPYLFAGADSLDKQQ